MARRTIKTNVAPQQDATVNDIAEAMKNTAVPNAPEGATPRVLESYSPPSGKKSRPALETWTKDIAAKLAKSPVMELLTETEEAARKVKRGAVACLWELMLLFGCTQKWSEESGQLFLHWPRPGTAEKGVKKEKMILLAANDPDYPEWYSVKNPNKDGFIDVSWYRTLYEDMDPKLLKQLGHIKNALDKEAPTIEGNPFANLPQSTLETKKKETATALANGADRLRKAMAVYHKIHELLYEHGDVITIKLDTSLEKKDGKATGKAILNSGAIKVVDKENPEVAKAFDATAFLRLDADKATKDGATYAAVIGSGKAKRNSNSNRATTEELSKYNVASYETAIAFQAYFMSAEDKRAQLLRKLADDNNTDFLLSFGDVAYAAIRLLVDPRTGKKTALGLKYSEAIAAENEASVPQSNVG